MTRATFQYKGYTGTMDYSEEQQSYYGEIIGITDILTFEGLTHEAAYEDFKEVIDEYLAICLEKNIKPCKPPAKFTITIPPELYAQAHQQAEHKGIPVQTFMENAVQQAIS